MRRFQNKDKDSLQVVCNQCGKAFAVENGLVKEECISVAHGFGYFSKKDGIRHRFDLCEACYDNLVSGFLFPVESFEETELLGGGDFWNGDG